MPRTVVGTTDGRIHDGRPLRECSVPRTTLIIASSDQQESVLSVACENARPLTGLALGMTCHRMSVW